MTRKLAVALAATGLLAASACSSSGTKAGSNISVGGSAAGQSSTAGQSSAAARPAGAPANATLQSALISPAQIPGDTFTLKSAGPLTDATAAGVDGQFANAAGTRTVTDAVIWFPSAGAAATALSAEKSSAKPQIVSGLVETNVPVGTNGHIFQGKDAKGEATIVVFQQGNYVVTLEFNSPAGDVIPASLATGVAAAQDTKVKALG